MKEFVHDSLKLLGLLLYKSVTFEKYNLGYTVDLPAMILKPLDHESTTGPLRFTCLNHETIEDRARPLDHDSLLLLYEVRCSMVRGPGNHASEEERARPVYLCVFGWSKAAVPSSPSTKLQGLSSLN